MNHSTLTNRDIQEMFSDYSSNDSSDYSSYFDYEYDNDIEYNDTDDDDFIDSYNFIQCKKCYILLWEFYNSHIYGEVSREIIDSNDFNNQFIIIKRFRYFDNDYIYSFISAYKQHYYSQLPTNYKHPTIRNYNSLRNSKYYLKPEIGIMIYYKGYFITIIKTIWIKLIQRVWKKIYYLKKKILLQRTNPNSIKYRENYGCWCEKLRVIPGLKGMLANLVRK